MFGIRLSLAVFSAAIFLSSTASEAEARHCRHQRHHRHHGHRHYCDQGVSQGYCHTGYSGQHYFHQGGSGDCCGTSGCQQTGGYQHQMTGCQTNGCQVTAGGCATSSAAAPLRNEATTAPAPPEPSLNPIVAPTPGI